ncbi:MAG: hypothetical protein KDA66_12730 [Planctomycetaceae bacterium]|nr:hypothetical protein [Planctomycetaceae bacterium]
MNRLPKVLSLFMILWLLVAEGCHLPRWPSRHSAVLPPTASKTEIIAHLNHNVMGDGSSGGLVSWQTGDARASAPGMPFSLPTSIAVEAPRSFRLRTSHPMSGTQLADIGSNEDIFWVWMKTPDNMPIMTVSHEDVGLAMDELALEIPVDPTWMMEVFGVIPINEQEFEIVRRDSTSPIVDLVATRTSPQGVTVQRVIRVDTFRGQIIEHQLRDANGQLTALAELDNYRLHESDIYLPHLIRLSWPSQNQELKLELGHPDVNPRALAENKELWQPPVIHGAQTIDLGAVVRRRRGYERPQYVAQPPALEAQAAIYEERPGYASLDAVERATDEQRHPWGSTDSDRPFTPVPPKTVFQDRLDAPEPHPSVWARPVPAQPISDVPDWAK